MYAQREAWSSTAPIRGVMLDITGVLVELGATGAHSLSGAVEAVDRLKKANIKVRFVSNCTHGNRKFIEATINKMGFPVDPEKILTPIPILKKILKDSNMRPYLLVHKDSLDDFADVSTDSPTCVVVGDAQDNFSYANLNEAFHVLLDVPKARLFALGTGKYYRLTEGLSLDTGPFTKALEFASGIKAEVVGKPSGNFFNFALQDMNISPEEAVMVGDDYETDMLGAASIGVKGILVKTGKPLPKTLSASQRVADHVEQAVDFILEYNAGR